MQLCHGPDAVSGRVGLSCASSQLVGVVPGAGKGGVFDGTVENMHLHWKHYARSLVMAVLQSLRGVSAVGCRLAV